MVLVILFISHSVFYDCDLNEDDCRYNEPPTLYEILPTEPDWPGPWQDDLPLIDVESPFPNEDDQTI